MKTFGVTSILFAAFALLQGVEGTDTIFEIAEDTNKLSTLTSLLELTGLDKTLDGKKDYTAFAPTNAAFKRIDDDVIDCLLKKRNRKVLKDILLYHVVEGKVRFGQLENREEYKTVLGEDVKALVSKKRIRINDAKVIDADIRASNGIVHIVNRVLIPDAIDKLKCGKN